MRFCGTLRAEILFFLNIRNRATVVGDAFAVEISRRAFGINRAALGREKVGWRQSRVGDSALQM